jgi:hypothetical protein
MLLFTLIIIVISLISLLITLCSEPGYQKKHTLEQNENIVSKVCTELESFEATAIT